MMRGQSDETYGKDLAVRWIKGKERKFLNNLWLRHSR